MDIKPTQDRVLVRRTTQPQFTKSGLEMPDIGRDKREGPGEGVVLAVGPGRLTSEGKLIPLDVKVGDRIYFGKFSGVDLEVHDEKVVIVREEEIMAIIEDIIEEPQQEQQ